MRKYAILSIILAMESCKSTNRSTPNSEGTLATAGVKELSYDYYCTKNDKPVLTFTVKPIPNIVTTDDKKKWSLTSLVHKVNGLGNPTQQWWGCKFTNGLEGGIIPNVDQDSSLKGFTCPFPQQHSFTVESGVKFPSSSERITFTAHLTGDEFNGTELICTSTHV